MYQVHLEVLLVLTVLSVSAPRTAGICLGPLKYKVGCNPWTVSVTARSDMWLQDI
jgi:hypothetical protein